MSYEWDQEKRRRKRAFTWWLSLIVVAAMVMAGCLARDVMIMPHFAQPTDVNNVVLPASM